MKINNDYLSINNTRFIKVYPFKKGELISGLVEKKLSDNLYQILIEGRKFKAKYAYHIEGKALFKVIDNKEQLILQLISQKSNQTKLKTITSKFNLLKPYIHDPLLELIINKYLQYNLILIENELLTIYKLLNKHKNSKHKWLELIILMKSKGINITPNYLLKLLKYNNSLNQLKYDLTHILKSEGVFSKFIKNEYALEINTSQFKVKLKNHLAKLGYINKNDISILTFFIKLLKFYTHNQDNKLIKKILQQYRLEKESSIIANKSGEDAFFISIPLITLDKCINYLKLKLYNKKEENNIYSIFFEVELSYIKRIQGYCYIDKKQLHINLYTEKKEIANFLEKNFITLYKNNPESYFSLGSWKVSYKNKLDDFLFGMQNNND